MDLFLWIILLLPIPVQVDGQPCLSWKIQQNTTILTCRCLYPFPGRAVSEFINPFGKIVAYCNGKGCYTHMRWATIHNDISTQEVVLMMNNSTDRDINGQWTCICSFRFYSFEESVNLSSNIKYEKNTPTVSLISPKFSKANEQFLLTCKVKGNVSVLKTTIFQNGDIYAQMNQTANGCVFSKCPASSCYSSDDGWEYVFTQNGISRPSLFKCVVDFGSSETVVSNCAAVECQNNLKPMKRILESVSQKQLTTKIDHTSNLSLEVTNVTDTKSVAFEIQNEAEIILSSPLPLTAGTTVEIKCLMYSYYKYVFGSLKCRNASTGLIIYNQPHYFLRLTYKVSLLDNQKICSCHAEEMDHPYEHVFRKMDASIKLKVRGYTLNTNVDRNCTERNNVTMTCNMIGICSSNGFLPWMHSVNGQCVRFVVGIVTGSTSTIQIESCSLEDYGEYICTSWVDNDHNRKTQYTSKSKALTIIDKPLFISKGIRLDNDTAVMACCVFSQAPLLHFTWMKYDVTINSTSKYSTSSVNKDIDMESHGVSVLIKGYKTTITINDLNQNDFGIYTAIVWNAIGTSNCTFDFRITKNMKYTNDTSLVKGLHENGGIIYYVILPLISFVVLILLSVTMAICLSRRCKKLPVIANNDLLQAALPGDHYETIEESYFIPIAGREDNTVLNIQNDESSTVDYFEPINEENMSDDYSNYSEVNSETNIGDVKPAVTEVQYRNTYKVLIRRARESENHEYEQSENLSPDTFFSGQIDNDYIDPIHEEQESNASKNSHDSERAFQCNDVPASDNDNIGQQNCAGVAEMSLDPKDNTNPTTTTQFRPSAQVDNL